MGLQSLERFLDSMKSFDAEKEYEAIIENNTERINELQQEQLAAGVDITGGSRSDEYRPLTVYLKNKFGHGLGAVTDRVTFFMTGSLYSSLRAQIKGQMFQVESPLPTFAKMIDRIGNENYGLSPDQRLDFATEVTLPTFGYVLKEKTGLIIS